jgi:hypothetical protein
MRFVGKRIERVGKIDPQSSTHAVILSKAKDLLFSVPATYPPHKTNTSHQAKRATLSSPGPINIPQLAHSKRHKTSPTMHVNYAESI